MYPGILRADRQAAMTKFVEVKEPDKLPTYTCPECGKRLVWQDVRWCPDKNAGCNVNHHVYMCCYGCGKYWQIIDDKKSGGA